MKTNKLLSAIALIGHLGGCVSTATLPKELVDARNAYLHASTGVATLMASEELCVAQKALAKAEQSFLENKDSYQTRDLAYVAARKSLMAELSASINIERGKQFRANRDYRRVDSASGRRANQKLLQAKPLCASSAKIDETNSNEPFRPREAATDVVQEPPEYLATLADLAVIERGPRGMVLVFSGSDLFSSGQSTILPEARVRLDRLTEVLLVNGQHNLTVEGYYDSNGTPNYNLKLSQSRADAIRDYFVGRKYEDDRIQASGLGERKSDSRDETAERVPYNRRIEIFVEQESSSSGE